MITSMRRHEASLIKFLCRLVGTHTAPHNQWTASIEKLRWRPTKQDGPSHLFQLCCFDIGRSENFRTVHSTIYFFLLLRLVQCSFIQCGIHWHLKEKRRKCNEYSINSITMTPPTTPTTTPWILNLFIYLDIEIERSSGFVRITRSGEEAEGKEKRYQQMTLGAQSSECSNMD